MMKHIAAGLFAASIIAASEAATFHVAQLIPTANDESRGDIEHPLKTISKAAELVKPGDTVIIHSGVYRERVVFKTSGTAQQSIRIQAARGETVVLTGADRIRNWTKVDGATAIYRVDWPHRFITWNANMTHPNDIYHQVIGRCEQVIVNGYLLRQALGSNLLSPGSFFADVAHKSLFVWDSASGDLNKQHVEASTRQEILRVEGDYVQIRGLNFRYAANMAQHGAVVLAGRFNTLEDCVIESVNSSGATLRGEDLVVRRCIFRDNGQLGFGASRAHRLLFTACLVENNNTKNFDRGWEAGGDKLVFCRDAILEKSRFVRNRGNGIWFDIGNTNCTVRECLIAENEDAGIFYEISFALRAHDNVIIKNGFATTPGAWGAQAGISLSSSPGCVIERNIIAANREGFNFREQTRETPLIEDGKAHAIWNHDQFIRHNIIAFNRDAQIWGWFDVKDNRHWPAGDTAAPRESNTAKTGDIAERYSAKSNQGQPRNLSLQKLNFRFESNAYAANPGQGRFNWGVTWARHQRYSTLEEFQSALRIDRNSATISIPFADLTRSDFRIPRDAEPLLKAAYPKGTVPGVALGER